MFWVQGSISFLKSVVVFLQNGHKTKGMVFLGSPAVLEVVQGP